MKGKIWFYSGSVLVVLIIGSWLGHWFVQISKDWARLQHSQSPQVNEKMKFDASLAVAQAIVSGIGTVATIGGGIVLFLNFKVANENLKVANRNAEIANRNAQLTESRLLTERFAKAVEQLGSDKAEVRLGGIYSLERLAKDSRVDHWTIIEVLTTFIREKSSKLDEKTKRRNPKYDPEIQAILTVLGRRNTEQDSEVHPLDLSETNLCGFTFPPNSNFQEVNFRDASLNGAKLRKVEFAGADFTDANLDSVDATEADFSRAILEGAFLYKANFTKATFEEANLRNTRLREATFVEADFTNAILENAYFYWSIDWNQRHWTEQDWENYGCDYPEFEEGETWVPDVPIWKPDFRGSNLTVNQAKSAHDWEKAIYDDALRQSLSLPEYRPDEIRGYSY